MARDKSSCGLSCAFGARRDLGFHISLPCIASPSISHFEYSSKSFLPCLSRAYSFERFTSQTLRPRSQTRIIIIGTLWALGLKHNPGNQTQEIWFALSGLPPNDHVHTKYANHSAFLRNSRLEDTLNNSNATSPCTRSLTVRITDRSHHTNM